MEPVSPQNLNGFLEKYGLAKAFLFAPAVMREEDAQPELLLEYSILKRNLYVRQAWEIGRSDMDATGIAYDDDPVIPEGQIDPPIVQVIQWLRECQRSIKKGDAASTGTDSPD